MSDDSDFVWVTYYYEEYGCHVEGIFRSAEEAVRHAVDYKRVARMPFGCDDIDSAVNEWVRAPTQANR